MSNLINGKHLFTKFNQFDIWKSQMLFPDEHSCAYLSFVAYADLF